LTESVLVSRPTASPRGSGPRRHGKRDALRTESVVCAVFPLAVTGRPATPSPVLEIAKETKRVAMKTLVAGATGADGEATRSAARREWSRRRRDGAQSRWTQDRKGPVRSQRHPCQDGRWARRHPTPGGRGHDRAVDQGCCPARRRINCSKSSSPWRSRSLTACLVASPRPKTSCRKRWYGPTGRSKTESRSSLRAPSWRRWQTRLALELRSARARRESYAGE
jgi:hypothetical protein